ncbi:MAG: monofunctional biosynthetic peptidoglycan transglycosylase [Nitrospirae bacterium]|nr:monofunctional biosynthetic peptidoglycan transglycosylase [Nitrospirota bacterium]
MKKILYIILISFISISLVYIFFIPNVSGLKKKNPKISSMMEYRIAQWKKTGNKKRISQAWVPVSRISPYLIKAVLIAEDDKFWSHDGFDYEAIQKAVEKNIKAGRFKAGGSTISQQLAKNLYLTPEKSIIRKIREAIITWRIERALSKRRILEIYLNVVEWGDGIFGAESAARHYFGKSAADLDPLEAARLASVLPNPIKYNPSGGQRYVVNRSNVIYNVMVRRGIVIPVYEEIQEEVIIENPTPDHTPVDTGEVPMKQEETSK